MHLPHQSPSVSRGHSTSRGPVRGGVAPAVINLVNLNAAIAGMPAATQTQIRRFAGEYNNAYNTGSYTDAQTALNNLAFYQIGPGGAALAPFVAAETAALAAVVPAIAGVVGVPNPIANIIANLT
jgi:hypothetical protein